MVTKGMKQMTCCECQKLTEHVHCVTQPHRYHKNQSTWFQFKTVTEVLLKTADMQRKLLINKTDHLPNNNQPSLSQISVKCCHVFVFVRKI